MAHADGFPTLLPRRTSVKHARFQTPPVIYRGKRHGLAIGGNGRIHLIGLDEKGRFSSENTAVKVATKVVRAIAYSEKHDRLFVGVDRKQ
jgi:hypothetical protein